MTNEKEPASEPKVSVDVGSSVSGSRRRLLKGTALTAPVLLTLPNLSLSAASNGLQLQEKVVTAELAKDPYSGNYVHVLRPTYLIQKVAGSDQAEIINTGLNEGCLSGTWVDYQTLATTYSVVSCSNGSTLSVGDTLSYQPPSGPLESYKVVSVGDPKPLIVQLDQAGAIVGVGKSSSAVYVSTQSSWCSMDPGNTLCLN